jgi:flagellar motor protein MotB
LRIAVALLGLRVALGDIVALGLSTALIVIIAMVATIAFGLWLANFLGLSRSFGALSGVATGVCGASAALATSSVLPNYQGKEADTEQGKGKAAEALNEEQKKAAAESLDKQNFEKLEKELREKIADSSMLAGLQGQLQISREKDGLRIEVIDKADFSMFALGTTKMLPRAQALIDEIARSVATMPNKVTVRGHTDSVPFANPDGRNNWSLSAERAEAMRLILEKRGVKSDRFQSIEGVADTDPFNPTDKADPRNRRISVTLKFSQ